METVESNGTAKTGRRNAVVNIKVDEVDLQTMRGFIANPKNGATIADAMSKTTEQLAVALSLLFRETTPLDDLAECARCDGVSPADLAHCPFCGMEGEVPDEDDAPEAKATSAEDDVEEEERAVEESDDDGSPELDGDDAESAPEKKKRGRPKKAASTAKKTSQKLVKVAGKGPPMETSPTSAHVLDQAVEEVFKLKSEAFGSYLELAMKLREINKKQLWKLRVDPKTGKARYSGWDAFAHLELKMSPAYTYGLIEAAAEFTPEDFAQIGRTKAILLLKAAPKDRAELKAQVLDGNLSKKELKRKVERSRDAAGTHKQTQQAKAGRASAEKRAEKATSKILADKITIAQIEGRKRVKLYAKPPSLRNINLADCKRAKSIKVQPFGILALANEVEMHFTLSETEDGWQIVVDTRRVSVVEE